MADYQARINLLVTGQNRLRDVQTQLQQIEQTITDLERRQRVAGAAAGRSRTLARAIGGTEQPRGPGGQFAADPNRQQRFAILAAQRRSDVEERLSRILGARARAEADSINTRIAGQNRVNRQTEAQITLESRLNAAVDLYRTNLQKFERAGGTTNVALNRQVTSIRDAFAAFEAGGSRNLRLVRALATELGRVGEAQREINRTQSLGSKGFEAGRRLQERLTVVGQAGVTDPAQIRRARSLATEAIAASRTGDQQAYQEALRRATAATARLERESLETVKALNEAKKGYISSPLRGTATMPGSPAFLDAQAQRRSAVRRRIGGAVSGAAIGGAFPLLFGQGAGAAAGGAAGGLIGGLFGPGGSFAGSLLGTLIGDIASKGNVVKKLGEDIGFSAQQTKILETAFRQAGGEFDKFQASVQNIRGLSLEIEDQANAIRLVSTLTEKYGGEIDKTTNAYTSAIEAGKVTQATLNQLTNQGIPIQQALADKYKVSRSELLQMAKDGKISVQDLSDTLVDLGNKGVSTTEKTKTGFDNLVAATNNVGTALSKLGGTIVSSLQGPLDWLSNRLASIVDAAARGISRINDLLAGGKQAQAKIQASAQAQTLTRNKFGLRAANPFDTEVQAFRTAQENDIYRRLTGTKLGPDSSEARPPLQEITIPGQLPPSGDDGKSAADKAAEDAARLEQQIQERLRALTRESELTRQIATVRELQFKAEMDGDKELQIRLQAEERIVEIVQGTAQALDGITDERLRQAELSKAAAKIDAARQETVFDMERLESERTKAYEQVIADLNLELALKTATTEQAREQLRLEAELAKLKGRGFTPEQIGAITGLQAQVAAPLTDAQKIEQHIGKLKDEIAELTNIGNIAITVADGIGTAFGQAFQGLISGSMTAKEAFASFLRTIGEILAEEGKKMIATYIAIGIARIFAGLASSAGSTAIPGSAPQMTPGAVVTPTGFQGQFAGMAANGATFANGIAKFANGGIVSSPTLFKFADGGATRTGLMGEAGPEAIMPLKRGADGSLGVQANGLREAMGAAPGAAAGSPVLNMSFQSTTINGVEYVSRDQLEAAMAQTRRQASRDGAQRGMTMTLDRIQNSSSTRRRIGV